MTVLTVSENVMHLGLLLVPRVNEDKCSAKQCGWRCPRSDHPDSLPFQSSNLKGTTLWKFPKFAIINLKICIIAVVAVKAIDNVNSHKEIQWSSLWVGHCNLSREEIIIAQDYLQEEQWTSPCKTMEGNWKEISGLIMALCSEIISIFNFSHHFMNISFIAGKLDVRQFSTGYLCWLVGFSLLCYIGKCILLASSECPHFHRSDPDLPCLVAFPKCFKGSLWLSAFENWVLPLNFLTNKRSSYSCCVCPMCLFLILIYLL